MGSAAKGSEEGTVRSFTNSIFNFAGCVGDMAFAVLAAMMLLMLPALVSGQVAAHFAGAQITIAQNAFAMADGIAIDSTGDLFVADLGNQQVFEIPFVSGAYGIPVALSSLTFGSPSNVAVDAGGNLYVTDCGNSPAVYKVSYSPGYTGGTMTPIGTGSGNPFVCPNSVALDATGDVFVADEGNGTPGTSGVYEIAFGNNVATPLGGSNAFIEAYGIAVDNVGDVFVSDQGYGHLGIWEIPISNPSSLHQVGDGASFQYPSNLAFAKNGDLLVVDAGRSAVLRLPAGVYLPVSVAFTMTSPQNPTGLAIDSIGNFYLAASSSVYQVMTSSAKVGALNVGSYSPPVGMVFTFDADGTIGAPAVLTQGAPYPDFTSGGDCTQDSVWSQGQSCWVQVWFQPSAPGLRRGAVQLLDAGNNILATAYISGVGVGPAITFSPAGASAPISGLSLLQPQGIAVDAAGNLYFTDYQKQIVQKLPFGGGAPVTLMTAPTLGIPESVAVDGAGNVYVADSGNGTIWMVPYSSTTSNFGAPVAIKTGLSSPGGVAVDGGGNVYIAETGNHAVWELPWSATGGYGSEIQVNCAALGSPYSVTIDDSGRIYTADFGNSAIVIDPPGGCTNSSQETVNTNGSMYEPTSVAVDHGGNIYVANYGGGNVLEFPAGDFSNAQTISNVSLKNPFGLAFDGAGDLFISDATGAAISEFEYSVAPSLTYDTPTTAGTLDSGDGWQSAAVTNFGNASLNGSYTPPTDFLQIGTGGNDCVPAGFTLTAGQSCNLGFYFDPQSPGSPLTDVLTLTDNTGNNWGSQQQIDLSGTGTAAAATVAELAFSGGTPPPMIVAGSSAGVVTVQEESAQGAPLPTGGDSIQLQVTGPNNYSQIYTVSAAGGVATFNLSGVPLTVSGTYTYTAALDANGTVNTQAIGNVMAQSVPASLSVSGYPSPQPAGASTFAEISAVDQYGNLVQGYFGTVTVTTTDPAATSNGVTIPQTGIQLQLNGGIDTVVSMAFATVGTQTITASAAGLSPGSEAGISIVSVPNFVVNTNQDSGAGAQDCPINPTTGGSGVCTLRDALAASANAGAGNITFDSIVFAATNSAAQNTIQLSTNSGFMVIPSDTSITGPTVTNNSITTNLVTIDGGWDGIAGDSVGTTVFAVSFRATSAALNNLNIQHGNGTGSPGGGIFNDEGGLTVTGSAFLANTSLSGGAIYNSGNLMLTNGTFTSNSAAGSGHGAGGAIYNNATASISQSTFSGNSVNSSSSNSGGGGAICNAGGTLSITNGTFFGNASSTANRKSNPSGRGGAIVNHENGTLNVADSTISGNWASEYGGGIYFENGTLALANTIVSGNWLGTVSTPTSYDDLDDQTGNSTFTGGSSDSGGNVVGYYNSAFLAPQPTQPPSAAANLAPLGNYGGPTQTMIPLPGSAAICAGLQTSLPFGVTTDQRGTGYPNINSTYLGYSAGTPCVDAGAVQTNYAVSFSTEPSDASSNTNFAAGVTLTESGSAFQPAVTIPLTLTGTGTLTGGSAATAGGVADYTLQVSATGSGDTLTANLALNGSVTPQPAIAATSNSFSVGGLANQSALTVAGMPATAQPFNATFTVSSSGGSGTGAVAFAATGACSVNANSGLVMMTASSGTCSVTATKAADSNYNSVISDPATVDATLAAPSATSWPTAGAITYGQTLSSSTLTGGSATVAGSFAFTTPDTSPSAGSQSESVTFTPSDTTDYNTVAGSVNVTVNKAAPSVTSWPTAGAITYGQTLTSSTLTGGSASVGGSFAFTTPGTSPSAGSQSESVTFTPSDTTDYNTVAGSVNVTVNKATATMMLGSLNQTYTGSALVATAIATPSGLTVTFTYNGSSTAPTAAGSYAVVGTINDANYTGTQSGTLTISKAAADVTLGNLNQTYTGSVLVATATTNPVGLSASFTYNGSSTAPTNAGAYSVAATISDTNYNGSASGTLTIAKATATVTLGSLSQTYTGSALSATATTTPSGLTVNLTYNGSSTAPTAAGSYSVVATISDANYIGSASGTLTIAKTTATVSLGNLSQTYTGSALSATATTNPSGLTVNLTYNGSSTPPTAAGNYPVVAAVSDTNYTGSASGMLTIAKGTATVTLSSLSQTYTGSALSATATTNPSGLTVNLTYNGSSTAQTSAGSYTVVGTINDTNYQGSATGTLMIAKAAASVMLGSMSQTYTGSALAATTTTTPPGLTVNLTYNGSSTAPTSAGSYTVVGTINDTDYTGSASGTLTIAKTTATVSLGNLSQTYTGSALAATATTTPSSLAVTFTYDGSSTPPTAAGSYTVVGTVNDTNYQGSAAGTLVIAKAAASVTLGSLSQTYTGSALVATATTTPASLNLTFTYNGSSTAPTNAGTYAVVGTINNMNYTGSTSGTLVISKASATVTLGNLSQTYTGSPQVATATTTPSGLTVNLTYNGSSTAPTAAGSYPVVATISDANYIGSASGTLTIAKATAMVTLGSLSQTYTGSALSATATTTPSGLTVNLTYNGSPTAPTAAGSYPVVATVSDANYAGSTSGTLVISAAASWVNLTSSANPVVLTNPVTLTATVSSLAGTTAGQVSFLDGTTPLGSSTISAGVATFTTSSLAVGSHSITAAYQGNANFAGSPSSALSLTVVDLSVGSTGGGSGGSGSSETTSPGGSASYTVPLAPSEGTTFPSAITLTVTGLPPGATATLNTGGWTQQSATSWTLPANQPVSNVSLTFQVPTQTAAVEPNGGLGRKLPFVALGILLLPFARRWRKAGKRMNRWLCLVLVAGLVAVTGTTGCGGHPAHPQTYTVTVTVTAGTLTHSTQLTLTVE